jgi:hypothetical protein
MTTFWALWGVGALVALVVLYFFFIGLADGTVSAPNLGLWFGILAVVAGVMLGSLWLKSHGHLGWAKALLCILAVPGGLYGLFVLFIMVAKPRWN